MSATPPLGCAESQSRRYPSAFRQPGSAHDWLEDYDAAKAQAPKENNPLLVDFGAEWCGACKEMEHEAMSDPRVVAESQRFIPVREDMTHEDEKKSALLTETYKQPGLPLVVFHSSNGDEKERITGKVGADEFLAMMQSVL